MPSIYSASGVRQSAADSFPARALFSSSDLTTITGYGEAEFVFSIIKITAVIGFIILGIIIDCGGVPGDPHGYIGARYWYAPGAFNNGFKGLCSVFVTAAFSFAGTELCGLAAAETANPRKTLPSAIKQVFWRILIFYMISLTIVGYVYRPAQTKSRDVY